MANKNRLIPELVRWKEDACVSCVASLACLVEIQLSYVGECQQCNRMVMAGRFSWGSFQPGHMVFVGVSGSCPMSKHSTLRVIRKGFKCFRCNKEWVDLCKENIHTQVSR